jgi:hypothetical protein
MSPSTTINKYVYGGDNPLKYIDPDGRDITIFYEEGAPTGHVMLSAYNEKSGDFAFLSVGPQKHLDPDIPLHPWQGVPGTSEFSLPTTADELRKNFTAVTITTDPETAQQAINAIRNGAGTGNWALFGNNCTTACVNLLKQIGVSPGSSGLLPWTPDTFWENMMAKYAKSSNPLSRWFADHMGGASPHGPHNGQDEGSPRYGMDTFDWLMKMLNAPLKGYVSYGTDGHDKTCN